MTAINYKDLIVDEETGEVDQEFFDANQYGKEEKFFISSLADCEWYIEKINSINHKRNTLKKQYEAMLKDIDNQEKGFKYLYENQFITEVWKHIEPGKKNLKTLMGTAQFRAHEAKIEVNEKEAIPPEYVSKIEKTTIVDQINKELIIKEFLEGRQVDGVKFIPAGDSLSIK